MRQCQLWKVLWKKQKASAVRHCRSKKIYKELLLEYFRYVQTSTWYYRARFGTGSWVLSENRTGLRTFRICCYLFTHQRLSHFKLSESQLNFVSALLASLLGWREDDLRYLISAFGRRDAYNTHRMHLNSTNCRSFHLWSTSSGDLTTNLARSMPSKLRRACTKRSCVHLTPTFRGVSVPFTGLQLHTFIKSKACS